MQFSSMTSFAFDDYYSTFSSFFKETCARSILICIHSRCEHLESFVKQMRTVDTEMPLSFQFNLPIIISNCLIYLWPLLITASSDLFISFSTEEWNITHIVTLFLGLFSTPYQHEHSSLLLTLHCPHLTSSTAFCLLARHFTIRWQLRWQY